VHHQQHDPFCLGQVKERHEDAYETYMHDQSKYSPQNWKVRKYKLSYIPPTESHRGVHGIRNEIICMYLCISRMFPFVWPPRWSIKGTSPMRAWSFDADKVLCHDHVLLIIATKKNTRHHPLLPPAEWCEASSLCMKVWIGATKCNMGTTTPYIDLYCF
jgi:hypothetical protein